MSGASWSIDVAKLAAKKQLEVETAARAIVFEIFKRVILRTPVDTGAARGNWQIGFNAMPSGQTSDYGGVLGRIEQGLKAQPVLNNVVWLVNNLPYIGVLEYGGYPNPPKHGTGKTQGGFSKQAPAGMVRVTVQEVSDAVRVATSGRN